MYQRKRDDGQSPPAFNEIPESTISITQVRLKLHCANQIWRRCAKNCVCLLFIISPITWIYGTYRVLCWGECQCTSPSEKAGLSPLEMGLAEYEERLLFPGCQKLGESTINSDILSYQTFSMKVRLVYIIFFTCVLTLWFFFS